MKVLYIGATGLVGSHAVSILKNKFDITPAAIDGEEVTGLQYNDGQSFLLISASAAGSFTSRYK